MEKVIDATNKTIGRVATEAAMALMGKDNVSYQPNILSEVKVVISNAAKTKISQKKEKTKLYKRHSNYPSGLKLETLEKVLANKGYEELYRIAIKGMLPANRLRPLRMKNLTVND
jgi:large subunit ribosomal protein L13